MVILTPITINNHFNNANYVTKVDHLCSERHTFNFLLKKVDFRGQLKNALDIEILRNYNIIRISIVSIVMMPDPLCGNSTDPKSAVGKTT